MDELEKKLGEHDEKFQFVFEAIRQLMAPPASKKGRIGFAADSDDSATSQVSGGRRRGRRNEVAKKWGAKK